MLAAPALREVDPALLVDVAAALPLPALLCFRAVCRRWRGACDIALRRLCTALQRCSRSQRASATLLPDSVPLCEEGEWPLHPDTAAAPDLTLALWVRVGAPTAKWDTHNRRHAVSVGEAYTISAEWDADPPPGQPQHHHRADAAAGVLPDFARGVERDSTAAVGEEFPTHPIGRWRWVCIRARRRNPLHGTRRFRVARDAAETPLFGLTSHSGGLVWKVHDGGALHRHGVGSGVIVSRVAGAATWRMRSEQLRAALITAAPQDGDEVELAVAADAIAAEPVVRVAGVCGGAAVGACVLPRAVPPQLSDLLRAALRLRLREHIT